MKLFLVFYFFLQSLNAFSQVYDTITSYSSGNKTSKVIETVTQLSARPEILSGGFIDIIQNGQMNAAARLFKLYIGEPGKFRIPVSFYSGISANNFAVYQPAPDLAVALINPAVGSCNLSFEGTSRIVGNTHSITGLQLQYQANTRLLSTYNPMIFRSISFLNFIAGLGLAFVTGAWERNKADNTGVFWLSMRTLYSNSPPSILKEYFIKVDHPNLFGYAAGMGIEISQALNVKMFYYHFLNNRNVTEFTQPIVQLSFNYSTR